MSSKLFSTITFMLLWVFSMIFTIYVFLTVYEQLTERDIAFIPNVTTFPRSNEITGYLSCVGTKLPIAYYKFDDQIRYMEIPKINSRVELAPQILRNAQYYTRGNKSHIINNPAANELIIYSRNSWRAVSLSKDALKVADLIFLSSTDGKKFIFKVNKVSQSIDCKQTGTEDNAIKPAEPELKFITEIEGEMTVINAIFINAV